MRTVLLLTFLCTSFSFAFSQQMVYKPINSSFGGDTYNYNWLLNSANAQNQFKVSMNYGNLNQNSPIGSFQDNLNRQLLNNISNGLFGNNYDQTTMQPGVYNLGSLNVSISEYYGGLNIVIIDIKTGEQTNINLPNSY
ncbi:curli assembly protein CsgF [Faecalibacter bovis]|uniref:Curli production assembly/transport component CsgF n=1 Tax=Faecalibacter bovis TaxID=2898187 RepID=A0ABX7XBV0_9FLAO|nr:curli assembly protein CsgF [Faecalibacter bovis]MBS7334121.1 curli assembly protein CsgF [Weeksellaceae bacterium]QTV05289.1 curli assembly protein CsgF [Faecalibacter bovis]